MLRTTQVIMSFVLATAAFSTAVACCRDDFDLHATFVGEIQHNHIATVVEDIPEGTLIFYDGRLPNDRQLIVRPKGKLIQYTCPSIPNVAGLEESRNMGVCPQFIAQGNATKIVVQRASIEGKAFTPPAGLYHNLGIIRVASVLQNDNRVNNLKMVCKTGQDDGMLVIIDYQEIYHEILNSWDISKDFDSNYGRTLINNQPSGTNLPRCFTFSCWYKITGQTPTLQLKNLFELCQEATEPHLAGQTKKLNLCVRNAPDRAQLYVGLHGSKVDERKERVHEDTGVLLEAAVEEEFKTVSVATEKYTESETKTPVVLTKGEKKAYRHGRYGDPNVVLEGGWKYGSFYRYDKVKVPVCEDIKIVTQVAKPAVYEKTTYDLQTVALEDRYVAKEDWMNFVMHVNADTKEVNVFYNGTPILYCITPFVYSLNTPSTWMIGEKHAAQLAEVCLIQGQLVPASSFCARNSQNECVPLKSLRLNSTGLPTYFAKEPDGKITVVTDVNEYASYQLMSERFLVQENANIKIPYKITVQPGGKMSLGLLNTAKNDWYGEELILEAGTHEGIYERIVHAGETEASLVFRNYHLGTPGQTTFTIEKIDIQQDKSGVINNPGTH